MTEEEAIQLIAEVIYSSHRWYFNLTEALPLAKEVYKALKINELIVCRVLQSKGG